MNYTGTRIQVTQADIDNGQRGECRRCPIATAARRQLKRPVCVDDKEIEIQISDDFSRIQSYWLPLEAQAFIELFDSNQPVSPFSFLIGEPTDNFNPED